MTNCAFCGRENAPSSKFCVDCGKSIAGTPSRAGPPLDETLGGLRRFDSTPKFGVPETRVSAKAAPNAGIAPAEPAATPQRMPAGRVPCRYCSTPIDPALPFCPKCGGRVALGDPAPQTSTALCASCGNPVTPGTDIFCARCGARVAMTAAPPTPSSGTAAFSAVGASSGPKIAILDVTGTVTRTETLPGPEATVGRAEGELRFPDDAYMSPVHAQLSLRDGQLYVRDLGSRNGTWLFTDGPYKLQDGDTVLVGSQLLRFRRLGYPGPHPPEADATRRLGSSTPSADIAVMQQLRADGSARDSCHLSPARTVVIGRTEGDWSFPYDKTMSGRHAEIRSEDLEFIVIDLGSRNGIAIAVRGERQMRAGQRVLIGDQTLRVESV